MSTMHRPSGDPKLIFSGTSKRYRLQREKAYSFLELLTSGFRRRGGEKRDFWALRDFSLTVRGGEAVGLVGPNGAGKSTALKLACGVIAPTAGTVRSQGRTGALLELSAGFHPDLSGRENVYLSGALMGLSRREMDGLYDQVVSFSGVGDFIDTPLRHYSSGMAMRLGFAVATCVRPDVLLIDEVLAVGDRAFGSKCLERVAELKAGGSAILFVSHDLEAIKQFCDRAVLLEGGRSLLVGSPDEVVQRYLERVAAADAHAEVTVARPDQRWGSREVAITDIWLEDGCGNRVEGVAAGTPLVVGLRYRATGDSAGPVVFGLAFQDGGGYLLSGPNTRFQGLRIDDLGGEGEVRCRIFSVPFAPGRYFLSASIYDEDLRHPYDHWDMCRTILVNGDRPRSGFGPVQLDTSWRHER